MRRGLQLVFVSYTSANLHLGSIKVSPTSCPLSGLTPASQLGDYQGNLDSRLLMNNRLDP